MMQIVAMKLEDWSHVKRIYEEGIATGNATFTSAAPDWPEWDQSHLEACRLVARHEGAVLGWVALSSVSSPCVYGGVAEVSVYVAEAARGQGVGKALLKALIAESEQQGLWSLQAGVFPSNQGSILLLRACGFRTIGVREKLGRLKGEWRDVVLMERRSPLFQ